MTDINDLASKGLGRLPAVDERDGQFRMVAGAPVTLPAYRYYSTGPVLDQGPYPQCVGFAWRQWLSSALLKTKTGPAAPTIYAEAQKVDEWPGENYAGTSVRGGAKVLQSLGHIERYVWSWDALTVKNFILNGDGTVVVGTDWHEGMNRIDGQGYIHPTGQNIGGHAYLLVGFSQDRNAFRIMNSWGRGWGQTGRAWISYNDMALLISRDGEACTATEKVVL